MARLERPASIRWMTASCPGRNSRSSNRSRSKARAEGGTGVDVDIMVCLFQAHAGMIGHPRAPRSVGSLTFVEGDSTLLCVATNNFLQGLVWRANLVQWGTVLGFSADI